MEISVRSYLTAGVAAVVGATAIGLAPAPSIPAIRAAELPAPMVAEIALTGTSIPWDTIVQVVQALSSGGSIQGVVTSLISEVGTEFVRQAMPIVTAVAGDVVKYLGAALADLFTGPDAPAIDFPAIISAAVEAVQSGDFPTAVRTLTSALSAPLTQIGQVLFTPDFQAFLMDKVGTVLGALPEVLRAAVQTVTGIDLKPLLDSLGGLLGGLLPAASTLTAGHAVAAAAAAPAALQSAGSALVETADAPTIDPVKTVAPEQDSSLKAATAGPESAPAAESSPAPEAAPAAAPESAPADSAPVADTPAVDPEPPVAADDSTATVEVPAAPEVEAPAAPESDAPTTTATGQTATAVDEAPSAPTRKGRSSARGHGSNDSGAKAGTSAGRR